MARPFDGDCLVVASHNAGKAREIEKLLEPFAVTCLSAGALGLPEPAETGTSFEANAELKARAAAARAGQPALADDSGLAVDALDGAPGIHSARWAGPTRDFAHAMAEVERRLLAVGADAPEQRGAKFVSVLTLAWPDGHVETVRGTAAGRLIWPPRGAEGFGYDPIFLPAGAELTFAEMAPAAKQALSHRTAAFAELIDVCFR